MTSFPKASHSEAALPQITASRIYIGRMQIWRLLLGAVLALSAMNNAMAQNARTPLYHFVDGVGRIDLILNTEKVGIRFRDGVQSPAKVAVVSSQKTLDPGKIRALSATPDTLVVGTKSAITTSQVLNTLDRLAEAEDVYTTAPIVQVQPGFDAMVDNIFYVSVSSDTPDSDVQTFNRIYGVEQLDVRDLPSRGKRTYSLRLPEHATLNALAMSENYYMGLGALGAGPNFISLYNVQAGDSEPNDEYYQGVTCDTNLLNKDCWPGDNILYRQTGLDAIRVPEAWDYIRHTLNRIPGQGVVVAVLDGGVDMEYRDRAGNIANAGHPDLNPNQWTNEREVHGTANVDDDGNGCVDDFYGWNFHVDKHKPTGMTPQEQEKWKRIPFPDPLSWSNGNAAHGTCTAGIIAAATNNALGMAGIAGGWTEALGQGNGCKIMPVRVCVNAGTPSPPPARLNPDKDADIDTYAKGITYAADTGANIIVICGGFWECTEGLKAALDYAHDKGCVLLAPAHNYDLPTLTWAAASPDVIGVGALNRCKADGSGGWPAFPACDPKSGVPEGESPLYSQRKFGSNTGNYADATPCSCNPRLQGPLAMTSWGSDYGPALDLMAPGVWIFSTDTLDPDPPSDRIGYSPGDYTFMGFFGKTSSAMPQVAGVAALMLSATLDSSNKPTLTPAQVQGILQDTATDLEYDRDYTAPDGEAAVEHAGKGRDDYTGYGRVNALDAVKRAAETPRYQVNDPDGCPVATVDATGTFVLEGHLYFADYDLDLIRLNPNPVPGTPYIWPVTESLRIKQTGNGNPKTVALFTGKSFRNYRVENDGDISPCVDPRLNCSSVTQTVPHGSLFLQGRVYEHVGVNLDSTEDIPVPVTRFQTPDGVTMALITSEEFTNRNLDRGSTVPAGSLILKGHLYVGRDMDGSRRGRGYGSALPDTFCPRLRSDPQVEGKSLVWLLQHLADPALPAWEYVDLDHDGLPDALQVELIAGVLCSSSSPFYDEANDCYWTNLSAFDKDMGDIWTCIIDRLKAPSYKDTYCPPVMYLKKNLQEVWAIMMSIDPNMQDQLMSYLRNMIPSGLAVCVPDNRDHYCVVKTTEQEQVFSGDGDLDGDGLTNAFEYEQVQFAMGPEADRETCISAITDPDNNWRKGVHALSFSQPGTFLLVIEVIVFGYMMLRRQRRVNAAISR